jgi:hypothetical protein
LRPPEDLRAGDDFVVLADFFAGELARRGAALRLLVALDDFDVAPLRLEAEAPALRAPDARPFFDLEGAELLPDFLEAAADLPAVRFADAFFAPPFLAALFLAPPFLAPPLLFRELDDPPDDFLLPLDFDDAFFAADFLAAIGVLLFQNLSVGEPYVFEIRDQAAWQLGCTKPM